MDRPSADKQHTGYEAAMESSFSPAMQQEALPGIWASAEGEGYYNSNYASLRTSDNTDEYD